MKVMELRRWHQREVIAWVVEDGENSDSYKHHPQHSQMWSHEEVPAVDRQQIPYQVLYRVCVDAGDADGRSPLVM